MQTTEAEKIIQLIAGYIDIIIKRQKHDERLGDLGDEASWSEETISTPKKYVCLKFIELSVINDLSNFQSFGVPNSQK